MLRLFKRLEEKYGSDEKIASLIQQKMGPKLFSYLQDFKVDKDGVVSVKGKNGKLVAYFDLNDDGDTFHLTLVKLGKGRPAYKLEHDSLKMPKMVSALTKHVEAGMELGVLGKSNRFGFGA